MAAKFPTPDQFLGISCLVVGVGPRGDTSMAARVSIVDYRGNVLMDEYIQPMMRVTDYRTAMNGIEAHHLAAPHARPFPDVQRDVANYIRNKIIVGYTLWNDLSVLGIPHAAVATRDVALYRPFRTALQMNQVVGFPTLMWRLMRRRIQEGAHDSIENARAAMDLYRSHASEWEAVVATGRWPSEMPPDTFSRCYT
ncbi:ribonuclease H-like domain-containing protein [Irpex lacteus]|nr:ribonuclease H-like domain-containing protein [Irpex lacteus]